MTNQNDFATPTQPSKPTRILNKKEKGQNRHWKNFLDKNYLGSHNLEAGEEMLLTIQKFEGEEKVKSKENGEQVKPVLYFVEKVPKMILNITNGNTISALYGTHPENWVGKQIQVFAASVKAFGKQQDALRIRDFVPAIKVDTEKYSKLLTGAKTLAELQSIWAGFSTSVRNDKALIAKKDELKNLLK